MPYPSALIPLARELQKAVPATADVQNLVLSEKLYLSADQIWFVFLGAVESVCPLRVAARPTSIGLRLDC
jgi:hypothetical protein